MGPVLNGTLVVTKTQVPSGLAKRQRDRIILEPKQLENFIRLQHPTKTNRQDPPRLMLLEIERQHNGVVKRQNPRRIIPTFYIYAVDR